MFFLQHVQTGLRSFAWFSFYLRVQVEDDGEGNKYVEICTVNQPVPANAYKKATKEVDQQPVQIWFEASYKITEEKMGCSHVTGFALLDLSFYLKSMTSKSKSSPIKCHLRPQSSGYGSSICSTPSTSFRSNTVIPVSTIGSPKDKAYTKMGKKACKVLDFVYTALSSVMKRFDRANEIDALRVKEFIEGEMKTPPALTFLEKSMISNALEYNKKDYGSSPWKMLPGTGASFVPKYWRNVEGDPAAWGKAVGRVDISAEKLFAFLWLTDLNCRVNDFHHSTGNLPRKTTYNVNNTRSMLFSMGVKLPSPFSSRIIETWNCWDCQVDDYGRKTFIYAFDSATSLPGSSVYSIFDSTKGAVLAMSKGVYLIKELTPRICEYTMIQYGHANGMIPSWLVSAQLSGILGFVDTLRNEFKRPPRETDKELEEEVN